MEEHHAEFVDRLLHSQKAVNAVADWMRRSPYSVKVPKLEASPTQAESEKYKDSGDILVQKNGVWLRYEVKQRNIKFTCVDDYPYETIFICSVRSLDEQNLPEAFIILSSTFEHVAIINVKKTRHNWTTKETFDPKRGYSYSVYQLLPRFANFRTIR